MNYIIWFIASFIFVYFLYYVLFIRKSDRKQKVPSEVVLLTALFHLETNKFSYHKFLKIVGLVVSGDIALVATIVGNVDGVVWQILFGCIAVIPIVVISFQLLGKYYQKKQKKDNSKELLKEKKYLDKKNNKKKGKKKK